jgi:hypothetical protein
LAIARTTPALFGLFSIMTLMANQSNKGQKAPVRTAAWYKKGLERLKKAVKDCFRSSILKPAVKGYI